MAKKPANKMLRQYIDPDALDLVVPGSAIADHAAITAYTAHSSGSTTVTSNAATDLDTTAAGLATAVSELTTLRAKVNEIITALETAGIIST